MECTETAFWHHMLSSIDHAGCVVFTASGIRAYVDIYTFTRHSSTLCSLVLQVAMRQRTASNATQRGKSSVSVESADKSARIVMRVWLVASLMGKSPRAAARRLPREDPRARMSVSVSLLVLVPWNLSLIELTKSNGAVHMRHVQIREACVM